MAVAGAVAGLALAGCGAAGAKPGVAAVRAPTAMTTAAVTKAPARATSVPPACQAAVDHAYTAVAQRVYAQAAAGRNVKNVIKRFGRSTALTGAVAADSPSATTAALAPLLKHQVRRLIVTGPRGDVLATVGGTAALAPVTHAIRDASGATVGSYRLAVASDASIAGEIASLTGASVRVDAPGHHTGAAPSVPGGDSVTLDGVAFPTGTIRLRVAMPAPRASLCGRTAAATRAQTIAAIGRRLFHNEQTSPATRRVLARVQHDAAFLRAVRKRDPGALRTEIVNLFRDRNLHVVRIRAATPGGRLINDVGGPYALAPASAPLRSGGRTIGRVTLSIQDDTGYIKLMHLFTGAVVELKGVTGRIPGSNVPVPGRAYARRRFTVRAFPSGPLRVTLLT